MNAYEQAVTSRYKARTELERIEGEIQQVQQEYDNLSTSPMATAASHHTTEQERNRLAKKLAQLVEERTRWLTAHNEAEHAMQRELERQVHEWHGELLHQEQALDQATTDEEVREATMRRDQAQAELDRHEQELKPTQKQE